MTKMMLKALIHTRKVSFIHVKVKIDDYGYHAVLTTEQGKIILDHESYISIRELLVKSKYQEYLHLTNDTIIYSKR